MSEGGCQHRKVDLMLELLCRCKSVPAHMCTILLCSSHSQHLPRQANNGEVQ